jgi:hypothetical protein
MSALQGIGFVLAMYLLVVILIQVNPRTLLYVNIVCGPRYCGDQVQQWLRVACLSKQGVFLVFLFLVGAHLTIACPYLSAI